MIWVAVGAVITHRTKSITWNGCRHDGNIPINPNAPCGCKRAPQTQCLVGTVGGGLTVSSLQHGSRYRKPTWLWKYLGPRGRRRLRYRFWTVKTRNERIVSPLAPLAPLLTLTWLFSSDSTAIRDNNRANWHHVKPFKIYFRICFYISLSHHFYRYLLATTSAELIIETSCMWCWEQEESC